MRHFLLLLALSAPVAADPLELYRWFHTHPELSSKETATSRRLAQELKSLGLEVEEGVGGTGLMAILRGQPGGPAVLYRADMDALPVQEATGLPYASQVPGVMHACGHDLHMATAVAALGDLAKKRDQWKGTIVFVGQPAEELGNGAKGMLTDPRFQQVLQKAGGQPKMAFALHDNATLPVGQVSLTPGYVNANVDSVDIIVQVKRLRDGSRRVTSITEVIGMEGDVIVTQELFKFEYLSEDKDGKIIGEYRSTGLRPYTLEKARQYGFDQPFLEACL